MDGISEKSECLSAQLSRTLNIAVFPTVAPLDQEEWPTKKLGFNFSDFSWILSNYLVRFVYFPFPLINICVLNGNIIIITILIIGSTVE